MPTPLRMPKFEMSQEEGTIINWLRKEGDWVEKGEPVLEIETDKVVMEVEAPASGFLQQITAQAGERVPVTSVIATILQEGEEQSGVNSPSLPEPGSAVDQVLQPASQPGESKGRQRRESPLARRIAEQAGIDIRRVPATEKGGRVTREDVKKFIEGVVPTAGSFGTGSDRPRATPAARRVAKEAGLDLLSVQGSGPRKRIQERDVRMAMEASAADIVSLADSAAQTSAGVAQTVETQAEPNESVSTDLGMEEAQPQAQDSIETFPLQGMRRTIAERMQHSYQTAPHVTFTVDVDMSQASELRAKLNQRAETLNIPHISVTAILVRACAWALLRHPWINAALANDTIYRYATPNIGVAVALKEGLIVPVIHQADRLNLADITRRLQDLTEKANQGRLVPQDVTGGTFTISNLGMFGIDQFTAILNPPQCAILAVGRTVKKAVVVEEPDGDRVVIRPVMKMTLSADHRIVDGAVAARFLRDLRAVLEEPDLLLV